MIRSLFLCAMQLLLRELCQTKSVESEQGQYIVGSSYWKHVKREYIKGNIFIRLSLCHHYRIIYGWPTKINNFNDSLLLQ